ncbi:MULTISPECIES: DUF2786 domain-containing protein [Mycolicibacterium]|uniref:Protein of uncharacterized function (DUF2786) n=1 Tax=Mycolicibacterium senegalense TaxID=1796 RepID=A0A378W3X8_9MYCO|nr:MULTISPECIES: DUF2786 domain-containing protein [Mycolicibacterium]MCV7335564.1 DUF2786 domain-containing protein [Mycolicibacterium senegalense]MDR7288629.1 hypothetical protein [Mycolicibacterium senegalense]QZA25547.1 DUF2786 domain-containing protein [Mycolicibacterium senegalense]CDP85283.1 hypothetical protein BN975_02149 [Mycolicibacterium farcinogenes]SUA27797.1 Protein of uncharacterised function (DUF2786) [Mycolicibacterium senegalense]
MSRRNRQKRAAKHKDRRRASSQRERWSTDPGYDRVALLDRLTAALYNSALCPDHDAEFHAAELLDDFPDRTHELDLAAEGTVAGAISGAWQVGWSPNDLHEFARRRLDAAAAGYLAEAIVRESRHYPVTSLHPRWRAELTALPVDIGHGAPQMWDWAHRNAVDHQAALTVVLKVLRLLGTLPKLVPLLPVPGAHQHSAVAVNPTDAKALSRVRGLLAKAEATKFPEEAEALSAKAQELMSRYSLQHAIRDHEQGRAAEATARRIWIDSPYVSAKAALVQSVATANRCQMVCAEKLGFVAVIGAECDLEFVELLATSLLVQANRAMLAAGRTTSGHTRTRSFRQSFLLSYAARIGERLTATSTAVATEVDRGTLLPVLAARSQATEDLTNRLFPATIPRMMSPSNGAGWAAGRIAADLAQLDVRRPIAG